jgi:hypothetical protein
MRCFPSDQSVALTGLGSPRQSRPALAGAEALAFWRPSGTVLFCAGARRNSAVSATRVFFRDTSRRQTHHSDGDRQIRTRGPAFIPKHFSAWQADCLPIVKRGDRPWPPHLYWTGRFFKRVFGIGKWARRHRLPRHRQRRQRRLARCRSIVYRVSYRALRALGRR